MLKTQCHAVVGWSISRIQHERYFNKNSSTPDKLTSGQYTTQQVDASSIEHAVSRRVFSRRCSVDVRQVDARQVDSIPSVHPSRDTFKMGVASSKCATQSMS